jgi:hypothetical protein
MAKVLKYRSTTLRILLGLLVAVCLDAAEYHGLVKLGGLPVPGAAVTAEKGTQSVTVITDQEGSYSFPDLADGTWSLRVEMQGFAATKQEVTVPSNAPALDLELKILPFSEIHAEVTKVTAPEATTAATPETPGPAKPDTAKSAAGKPAAGKSGGFRRTEVNATGKPGDAPPPPPPPGTDTTQSTTELSQKAADGFLVNGSVNNGAASPFAQFARFGNGVRNGRSLYSGMFGFTLDNSNLDARSVSFTGQDTPKPDTNRLQGLFLFNGPIRIPHVLRNGPQLTINYQWLRNRISNTLPALMPTADQRNGIFTSQVLDPLNQLPFPNNIIPQTRISDQARALLNLYPLPNFQSSRFNYQIPVVNATHQDSMQARVSKQLGRKDTVYGLLAFQWTRSSTPSVFGFLDSSDTLGLNTNANWRHSLTPRLYLTLGVQFSRFGATTTPFFANRENISGAAGITGNNQDAVNWGPPSLSFASTIAGLSDGIFSSNHNQTTGTSGEVFWAHRSHNVTAGAEFRRQQYNVLAQQNPRGSFTFTGAATGSDFGGFLLGVPDTASIAYGNADKYFRSNMADVYIADDWKVRSGLTLNLGVRWDYGSPISELFGRLVNLDVTPGFGAVSPVKGFDPTGPLSAQSYPGSLVRPDKNNFSPRVSFAWRPLPASSMLIRGGYGIYYDTSVYGPIAGAMSQQAPLSKSLLVANSAASPLSLANGFSTSGVSTSTTFAIDPNFRTGYAQNWNLSVQRDLPFAMQMTATYLGIKGTRGVQQFYPNTYPAGVVGPCACPSGFTYMTSNGNSTREAGTLQLRRRLRSGFTAELSYTYAKAIDDAAMGGRPGAAPNQAASQSTYLVAQDWTNLSGERALSTFDQRHVLAVTGQYTTGQGIRGGTLLSGWRGAVLKEWTVSTQISAGTGLPLTPVYFAPAGTTGAIGSLRPDYTGASIYTNTQGLFLNPQAYTKPTGHYGDAGRDSITGPAQFAMSASLGRTFRWGDRLNADLRFDSANVINHVTYPSWNTTVGSSQFGLPSTANSMRTVQTSLRVRF